MTRSPTDSPLAADNRLAALCLLAALAAVLQTAESLVPLPLPGVKLGLANMVTLVAMAALGFSAGIVVTLLRVLAGALVMGTFLSPGFLLSLAGAVAGALAMGLVFAVNRRIGLFSLVGISIIGALANNAAQLGVVYLLFARTGGIAWLVPWLIFSALAGGCVTGIAGERIYARWLRVRSRPDCGRQALPLLMPQARPEHVAGLLPELAIGFFVALLAAAVTVGDYRVYGGILAVTLLTAAVAGASLGGLARHLRRVIPLALVSVFFALIDAANGGMAAGLLAGERILSLMVGGLVVSSAAAPHQLAAVIQRLLMPLRLAGLDTGRVASSLGMSMEAIPRMMSYLREQVRARGARRHRLKRYAAVSSSAIVAILGHAGRGLAE